MKLNNNIFQYIKSQMLKEKSWFKIKHEDILLSSDIDILINPLDCCLTKDFGLTKELCMMYPRVNEELLNIKISDNDLGLSTFIYDINKNDKEKAIIIYNIFIAYKKDINGKIFYDIDSENNKIGYIMESLNRLIDYIKLFNIKTKNNDKKIIIGIPWLLEYEFIGVDINKLFMLLKSIFLNEYKNIEIIFFDKNGELN